MADLQIAPSKLKGDVVIPPSKSHTLRAIVFASLAKGTSTIKNFLKSPDTNAMIHAVKLLGAKIVEENDTLFIEGCNGSFKAAEDVIDCRNSGQVLRFIGALSSLSPTYTVLTGDNSIRHNRPVKPLLDALENLGVFAKSSRNDSHAPIIIKGPFLSSHTEIEGSDSQPVSGLLIASAFAKHPISISVKNPGELPWIDLTLYWLDKFQIPYQRKGYSYFKLKGSAEINGFTYEVPGDFSTAAFPLASALLTNSEITLHNLDLDDPQGDKALIPLLQKMGALFAINKNEKTIKVLKSTPLEGISIDINSCIDALPILSVIGCFARGKTEIFNGSIARKKESDRISAIVSELRKMGAIIEEKDDGLIISPSDLKGATLSSHEDHRIAMSLAVAALAATNSSTITSTTCIQKTYPTFFDDFANLGASISK